MNKIEFFEYLKEKDFAQHNTRGDSGEVFFTKKVQIEKGVMMSDGYDESYLLTFRPRFGIRFDIDKISEGGFMGNAYIKERVFAGHIKEKSEFETILKTIQ